MFNVAPIINNIAQTIKKIVPIKCYWNEEKKLDAKK